MLDSHQLQIENNFIKRKNGSQNEEKNFRLRKFPELC